MAPVPGGPSDAETASNLCECVTFVQHLVTLSNFGDDLFWRMSFAQHELPSRIYYGRSSHILGGSSGLDHSRYASEINASWSWPVRSHVALNTVIGFSNKSLCASVSQLLGGPCNATQMTYDLRKLRVKGLMTRIPHTNSYTLTPEGIRFAITYTKLGHRVLPPLLVADEQPAAIGLQRALCTI